MRFGFSGKRDIFSVNESLSLAKELKTSLIQTSLYPDNKYRYKLSLEDRKKVRDLERDGIDFIAHSLLVSNLASPVIKTSNFSRSVVVGEIFNCNSFNVPFLVVHPGSCENKEQGLINLAKSLDFILDRVLNYIAPANMPTICVETMAGSGNQIGSTPLEFVKLFSLLKHKEHVGICIDTAHIHGAGFSITDYKEVLSANGLDDKVKVIHFNNSKVDFGSKKDRHELLYAGKISKEELQKTKVAYKDAFFVIETVASSTEELLEESKYFSLL